MTAQHDPPSERAQQLLATLRHRAAAQEAVGVLAVWGGCDQVQARAELAEQPTTATVAAEAARVAAISDAGADDRADPDWQ
jgi:Fe-S cluster assembly iron-binding protein IscA